MAIGISNFNLTSQGNDILVSLTWDGFTCISNPTLELRLIDTNNNLSVAALLITIVSGGGTGTVQSTFTNIYNGNFFSEARFICDGSLISIYESLTFSHSTSIIAVPGQSPSSPTSGPQGIQGNNTNPNNNPSFCIGTTEANVSFSKLNTLFGRNSNTPNTSLSGISNPSLPPSLMGLSYLPLGGTNPGSKLIYNAVSEFRGQCNYAAPNEYKLIIIYGNIGFDGSTPFIVKFLPFEIGWIHELSGIITTRCPFNSSRIRIFTNVIIQDAYVGSTIPSPYQVIVKHISSTTTTYTTSRVATSIGNTTEDRSINLAYNDRVTGELRAQSIIENATATFTAKCQVNTKSSDSYDQLASVNISAIQSFNEIIVSYILPPSGQFYYEFSNNASGVGVSSTLTAGSFINNTTSSSASGSGNSSNTGNRTVSVVPSSSNLYTTLTIQENNVTIYNQTQEGTQTTTINFQSDSNYIIYALSTTAIQ
jgi:hypothetical protein